MPPADLAARRLPLKTFRGLLFRIHRSSHACLHFSKDGSGRFDDPLGKFGVLYGAPRPETAFAEVFLRHLSLMLIVESDLQQRSLSQMMCKPLRCVDLTGAGLRRLSCDNRISTELPYSTTGSWSRALFEHPQRPDGLIYLSRHNPRLQSIGLFDRGASRVKLQSTHPLLEGSRCGWTIAQIAKYRLAIEPLA